MTAPVQLDSTSHDRPSVAVITAGHKQHDQHLDQIGGMARAVVAPDLHVVISMGDRDLTRGRVPLGHDRWQTIVRATPPGPLHARRVLARDAGARVAIEAGAELLIFLDADALPSLHLVERYAEALARPSDAPQVLCGALVDPGPRPAAGYAWSRLDQLVVADPGTTALAAGEVAPEPRIECFRSASFGITAADVQAIGGMLGPELEAGEHDLDLVSRLQATGGSLSWLGGVAALRRPRSLADVTPVELDTLARAANRFEERWDTRLTAVPALIAAERAGLLHRRDDGLWSRVDLADGASTERVTAPAMGGRA